MKLYAPSYYKKFKCIADRCEHSCCIGWEIDIDEDTLKKYKKLKGDYVKNVLYSISTDDTPHFILTDRDRCPHLDECGLCKIIINFGEEYLCDICREHPRFYNYTSVAEVGLGMSCPEAARLILASSDYAKMSEIGCVEAKPDGIDFDGRAMRNEIYEVLNDGSRSYSDRLKNIYRKYNIEIGEDSLWLRRILELEYLDPSHKELFMNYSSNLRPKTKESEEYLERFLAYLVYRHCTEAYDFEDFCARLGFTLFGERLLASLICSECAEGLYNIAALASVISEEIEYSYDNTLALI